MTTELADLVPIYAPDEGARVDDIPLELSVGYQLRVTHRALQRYLQAKIEPYGVTLGMWYFLRALWQQDGVTQSELSRSIGTMEPTTQSAIVAMERSGIVRRVKDKVDRRRRRVFLTAKGRELKRELLPLAAVVVQDASRGLTLRELTMFLECLKTIQGNLSADLPLNDIPDEL